MYISCRWNETVFKRLKPVYHSMREIWGVVGNMMFKGCRTCDAKSKRQTHT